VGLVGQSGRPLFHSNHKALVVGHISRLHQQLTQARLTCGLQSASPDFLNASDVGDDFLSGYAVYASDAPNAVDITAA